MIFERYLLKIAEKCSINSGISEKNAKNPKIIEKMAFSAKTEISGGKIEGVYVISRISLAFQ
ncbi:MAG: hypothetical protein QW469_01280 [Candidatus Aenigmatarchaeota archaeon]